MASGEQDRPKALQNIPQYVEGASFKDFIQIYEICCQINGWQNQDKKLRLAMYLTGLPLQLYFSMMKEPSWQNTTYEQVKERIEELITPLDNEISAERKIQERMQFPSEKPTLYFLAKRKLIEELAPEASIQKKLFYIMVGLSKEYLDQVAHTAFTTVEELNDKLKELESKKFLFEVHEEQLRKNAQKHVMEFQTKQMVINRRNWETPAPQAFQSFATPPTSYEEGQNQIWNYNPYQTAMHSGPHETVGYGKQPVANSNYSLPPPTQRVVREENNGRPVQYQACNKLEQNDKPSSNLDSQVEELRKQMTNLALAVAQQPATYNNNGRGRGRGRGSGRNFQRGGQRGRSAFRGRYRGGRRGYNPNRGRGQMNYRDQNNSNENGQHLNA